MPIINVNLLAGRTVEQKREFAKEVTEAAVRILQCGQENVKLYYNDLKPEDLADAGVLRCDKK